MLAVVAVRTGRAGGPSALFPVAYNVLLTLLPVCPHLFICHLIATMPSSGTFASSTLNEILRVLVNAKQTGYLKVKDEQEEGCLAIENGILLSARAGLRTGLPALFQFVAWRGAQYDFLEKALPVDVPRDLAVYDPEVLITGVAFKVEELALLSEALPALDAVLYYVGGEGLSSVEVTSADLGMLALADGRRTVREMAEKMNLSPTEVARNLARFRLAGVLDIAPPSAPVKPGKSAMAAAG